MLPESQIHSPLRIKKSHPFTLRGSPPFPIFLHPPSEKRLAYYMEREDCTAKKDNESAEKPGLWMCEREKKGSEC